jgi:hypothetical protein
MSPEQLQSPAPKRPYEIFGLTEQEQLFWRVDQKRFTEILNDERTIIHKIEPSSNDYGEFLFVTASRPGKQERIYMTFYGLGYHEYRERWITNEWFWYQAEPYPDLLKSKLSKKEAEEKLQQRLEEIQPDNGKNQQSSRGMMFEILADLTDEDGAKAEMEDMEDLHDWLTDLNEQSTPQEPPPIGEYLLDKASREKLPALYSNEEKGLDALAQAKFFTPDSNWTWYASEFDGEDTFFGRVSGFEVELGYFSLKELQEARGPLGLQIERDLNFESKTLSELMKIHRGNRDK